MKSFVQKLAVASFYFSFSTAFAAPPVAPFYESVMQISPTGKLGQVIKTEQIKTSLKAHKPGRLRTFLPMYVSVRQFLPHW